MILPTFPSLHRPKPNLNSDIKISGDNVGRIILTHTMVAEDISKISTSQLKKIKQGDV